MRVPAEGKNIKTAKNIACQ